MGMQINYEKLNEFFEIVINIENDKVYSMELSVVNDRGDKIYPFGKSVIIKKRKASDRIRIKVYPSTSSYRVYMRLFADGKLEYIHMEAIEDLALNEKEMYEIIENNLLEQEDKNNMFENQLDKYFLIRNLSYSWRVENKDTVSIFDVNGNLLFLHDTMARLWIECDGKQTISTIANKIGIDEIVMVHVVKALSAKRMIVILHK